jgi:tRNA pseudouridine38-40 synthase
VRGGDAGGEARLARVSSDRGSRVLKITLAYDGTRFVGWQRQTEGESIQGLVEDALAPLEGQPVTVIAAGRTDAGVHAEAQVASTEVTCRHDCGTLLRALNARLPPEVRVIAVEDAPPRFNARFAARSKTYRYQIANTPVLSPFLRAYAWHVPEALDRRAMSEAAATLVGTHDFAAFQSTGSDVATTVRAISRSDVTGGELLVYEVEGSGFLRHMVRAIAGTLVEVGRGWRQPGEVQALLDGGSRGQAGATAPACGLVLVKVEY